MLSYEMTFRERESLGGAVVDFAERSRRVDELFAQYDQAHTPGLIVVVTQGGEIVHLKGYGRANIEFDEPWTPDTRYAIASVTKQFIGAALLLLEDQGELSLEDEIQRFLPEMPRYERPISIRHMLNMASGIKIDEDIALDFAGDNGLMTLDYLYEGIVTKLRSLNFLPGDHVVYSCSNYRLAARIIERVTGKPINEAMTELLFAPLGMNSTLMHTHYGEVYPGQGYLYEWNEDGIWRRYESGIPSSGDGAIVSTVSDMLRWIGQIRENTLGVLNFYQRWTSTSELTDGSRGGYGLGIGVGTFRGFPALQHGGLYGTQLMYLPEQDLAVYVARNRNDLPVAALAREVADIYLLDQPDATAADVGLRWYGYPEGEDDHYWLAWQGRYVQPEYGYILDLTTYRGAFAAALLGATEPLRPISRNRFVSAAYSSAFKLEIEERGDGQPPVVRADAGKGRWLVFEPAPADGAAPSPDDFLGDYFNDEAEIWQRVLVHDDRLTLRLSRGQHPSLLLPMVPVAPDIFQAGGLALKFIRDASGAVAAVSESTNRVRDMYFERALTPGPSPASGRGE
jgi:CubicO group peptidase (beta-lactamase class C family)